ncbi:MAG: 50S ribosomal protein L1 [Thermodesulfobacteriota bacterium]|nr:50S ribosomal protein L1 [Thermodesulfobacteriota bacterium]
MAKRGKKITEARKKIDANQRYAIVEGLSLALESRFAAFDESVDIAMSLGVDPRHADQMVRGSVVLPNGIGKEVKVLVFAKGEKEKEALDAGADFVGNDDLIEDIKGGWFGFDKAVATPDMMSSVGKIGKMLGPRGLMPNAKTGTVTFEVAKAVNELKAGKIDFRVDKTGIIHATFGKSSFGVEKLKENLAAFLKMVNALKPASSKGTYIKGIAVSTSMGPSVKLEPSYVKDFVR